MSFYGDDCESPRCYTVTTPVARKEHQCCECGGIIKKGEKYRNFKGMWLDGPAEFKTCAACLAGKQLRGDLT